jgi:signal transduction histidine kinase
MSIQSQLETVASASFLQSVLDALTANIAILNGDGLIMAVNASWRRFGDENGLSWPDYGIGRNYLAAMDAAEGDQSDDAHGAALGIRDVIAGRRAKFAFEYPCDSPDEQRWYVMWVTPLALPGRRDVVIAHEDITLRKLSELSAESARAAEAQQRRIAERRRAIAAGLGDILGTLNSDRPLLEVLGYIAQLAQQLLGAQTVALLEEEGDKPLLVRDTGLEDSLLSAGSVARIREMLDRDSVSQEVVVADSALLGDPGGEAATWLIAPVVVEDERFGVLVVHYARLRTMLQEEVDLVQDVATQISLAIGNARLRERVENHAVAAERGRMLRELHDSVSQALFSATLIADALPRLWEQHPQQAILGLEELRRLTRTAHADIRSLLLDLGPRAVTGEPLGVLLRRLAESISGRSGIPIQVTVAGEVVLPVEAKIALYRISEEALNNAVKHASATEMEVVLEQSGGRGRLAVRDNGVGFAPDEVPEGRLGLGIMRERAESMGAKLQVSSEPGHGCRVEIVWQDTEGV